MTLNTCYTSPKFTFWNELSQKIGQAQSTRQCHISNMPYFRVSCFLTFFCPQGEGNADNWFYWYSFRKINKIMNQFFSVLLWLSTIRKNNLSEDRTGQRQSLMLRRLEHSWTRKLCRANLLADWFPEKSALAISNHDHWSMLWYEHNLLLRLESRECKLTCIHWSFMLKEMRLADKINNLIYDGWEQKIVYLVWLITIYNNNHSNCSISFAKLILISNDVYSII